MVLEPVLHSPEHVLLISTNGMQLYMVPQMATTTYDHAWTVWMEDYHLLPHALTRITLCPYDNEFDTHPT